MYPLLMCILLLGSTSTKTSYYYYDFMDYLFLVSRLIFTSALIVHCKLAYDNMQLNKQIMEHNQTLLRVIR